MCNQNNIFLGETNIIISFEIVLNDTVSKDGMKYGRVILKTTKFSIYKF